MMPIPCPSAQDAHPIQVLVIHILLKYNNKKLIIKWIPNHIAIATITSQFQLGTNLPKKNLFAYIVFRRISPVQVGLVEIRTKTLPIDAFLNSSKIT